MARPERDFTVKVDAAGCGRAPPTISRSTRPASSRRSAGHARSRRAAPRGCGWASCRAPTSRRATSTPIATSPRGPISTRCCSSATTSTSTGPTLPASNGSAGREPAPAHECVTLDDYRLRYASHHTDPGSAGAARHAPVHRGVGRPRERQRRVARGGVAARSRHRAHGRHARPRRGGPSTSGCRCARRRGCIAASGSAASPT